MTHLVVMCVCICMAPKNPKLQQGTRQAWQLQIALRGCVEQLNLLWNKCNEEEEGEVVTIYTIELLNSDSDFTFFFSEWTGSPMMSKIWCSHRAVHVAGWLKSERKYSEALKCYFRHPHWLDQRFKRHVEDLTEPSFGNGGSRIYFLIWLRLENIK